KPRQWPGLSVRDVKATADRFYWLAVRIEEMSDYWQAQSTGPQSSLPQRFAHIVERRQNSGPLSSDLTPPKPKAQQRSSAAKPQSPKVSRAKRRKDALERAKKKS